jgi:hypothetical protein
MKITIQYPGGCKTVIETQGEVTLEDVFSSIRVRTTNCELFSIAQRSGGIEVARNGKLLWSSSKERCAAVLASSSSQEELRNQCKGSTGS